MRTLVVGAGATGGYFGGRLLEAGGDVTFLVRERRAAELATAGLQIRSRTGDVRIASPPVVTAESLSGAFDVVLLSLKAYDLAEAMEQFAPAVGPGTAILPVLNGMGHLDALDQRFGRERVLGGQCVIAATLNKKREIVHLNESHSIAFGERDGALSARVRAIEAGMAGARFEARASPTILLNMWEKWVFLATLAGGTCLMRATVGEIATAPGGPEVMAGLLNECRAIAEAAGFTPRDAFLARIRQTLGEGGSKLTASMLRDIEGGGRIEADHVVGDLLRRGRALLPEGLLTLLSIVYAHLKAYEARRSDAASATNRKS